MKTIAFALTVSVACSFYSHAQSDLFEPDPSFFGPSIISQEYFLDSITETCKGLEKCYDSSSKEEESYQKQCTAYKIQAERDKLYNENISNSSAEQNSAKKWLLAKNKNFSMFMKESDINGFSRLDFVTEKDGKQIDSLILSEETFIDRLSVDEQMRWEQDNHISNDESSRYIDQKSWGITTIGIFHKECDQTSPVYKKQIELNPTTGRFLLSYFDFWSYLYNEQAKYHLDFSVENPNIKLISISKMKALDNKNIDCKVVLNQKQDDSDKTLCKATSIYRQDNQVKLSEKNIINYLEKQPDILKNTYTDALNKNQKLWLAYKNSTCLFPLLDKLPQYEKDTYVLFDRLSNCISKISISNQDQLQRQLIELQKKDSSFFNLQDNLIVNEQMNKPIIEVYQKLITQIDAKQPIFSNQTKALLEKSKASFEQYRNSSCLLEAANYKPDSPDFSEVTQKCINRLNTNYIKILNTQREINL